MKMSAPVIFYTSYHDFYQVADGNKKHISGGFAALNPPYSKLL